MFVHTRSLHFFAGADFFSYTVLSSLWVDLRRPRVGLLHFAFSPLRDTQFELLHLWRQSSLEFPSCRSRWRCAPLLFIKKQKDRRWELEPRRLSYRLGPILSIALATRPWSVTDSSNGNICPPSLSAQIERRLDYTCSVLIFFAGSDAFTVPGARWLGTLRFNSAHMSIFTLRKQTPRG
ncbi:hypothetical protein H4582DRAFT_1945920, partial [Lactarius indigo]